jgi:hypothetical protein
MYLERRPMVGLYLKWLITLVLLLPQTAWAQEPVSSRSSRSEKPGAVAAIIPIAGSEDFIAIAPIPESQQQALIRGLVQRNAEATVIGISGGMDPAVQGLGSESNIGNANLVQANRPEDIEAVNQLPRTLRQKLLRKIVEIKSTIDLEKTGLMLAYVSAAATAGATFVASGNYLSAGGMFGVLVAFNSYQYFFSKQWSRVKQYGHNAFVGLSKFVSRFTGRSVTETERQKFGMYGEFNTSWLANSAVTAVVLALSTDWASMSMQIPLQALVAGFVANPDVWDFSVRRIGENLQKAESLVKKFIVFRLVVSAVLDLATNLHLIQSTELFLGTVTISGLMWMLAGDKVEREIVNKFTVSQNSKFKNLCTTYFHKRRGGI